MYVNYEQKRWYYDFFQFLDTLLPPGGQIQKSIWLKCCTPIDFTICHKFANHCPCKLWTGMMIFRFFVQFLDIDAPGGQIQKSILLKCSTPIHFMICYMIAIHCACKLWTGTMILWFFSQHLDMSLPPGGQIQKLIWLKCCTLIDFMICHMFAIHCACKLWTGMILWFSSNF